MKHWAIQAGLFAASLGLTFLLAGPNGLLAQSATGSGSELLIGGKRYAVAVSLTPLDGGTVTGPVAAPSDLALVATTKDSVRLIWRDNSGNETAFAIFRRDALHDWTRVGVVPANVPVYTDAGLAPNIEYRYRVRATNNSAASPWSPELTAFPFAAVETVSTEPLITAVVDAAGQPVTSATPGQAVTILGEHFGTGAGLVSFNSQSVPVVAWGDTRIAVRLDQLALTPLPGLLLVRRPDGHYYSVISFPIKAAA